MRQAEALVGTDGSAMHLAAFARPGTRILTFDTRNLMNQRIINELAGLEASTVDVPAGGPVRDIEAHLARLLG
jgi:capsular polysaccharide biosynthesis protein